jgi:hypothetical protein
VSDHTQSVEIAKELNEAMVMVKDLSDLAGEAKQILEFASDDRKSILAKHMNPYLLSGDSVAKAEYFARTSEHFISDMDNLRKRVEDAHQTIYNYETGRCMLEARRSLLSHSKYIQDDLQG